MRIAFVGAQGTGKTTLVNKLLTMDEFVEYKQYTNVQRILHDYLGEKFPHSSKTNNVSQASISSNFVLQLLQNTNIICDRSLIDTFVYAKLSENVSDWRFIENTFADALDLYDVIFYTPYEFDVEEDGFRDANKDYIKLVDYTIKYYIEKYKNKVKIVEVNGSVEDRIEMIKREILCSK